MNILGAYYLVIFKNNRICGNTTKTNLIVHLFEGYEVMKKLSNPLTLL